MVGHLGVNKVWSLNPTTSKLGQPQCEVALRNAICHIISIKIPCHATASGTSLFLLWEAMGRKITNNSK